MAGRISPPVRSGRRRVAGPTQGFRDAAGGEIRPVPKGLGANDVRTASFVLEYALHVLRPHSLPRVIVAQPRHPPKCQQTLDG